MKFKSLILAAGLLAFNASATIIEYDDKLAKSFKDTDSGLVWMDFGVNNNRSYNDVVNQLAVGGDYYGWRLPTALEVYAMWANVANLAHVVTGHQDPDAFGPGQLSAHAIVSDVANGYESPWEATWNAMGHNKADIYVGQPYTASLSVGLFAGSQGLALVYYYDFEGATPTSFLYTDRLSLQDGGDLGPEWNTWMSTSLSTLLVRTASLPPAQVDAPSSIALFALALLGLGVKRRRKA